MKQWQGLVIGLVVLMVACGGASGEGHAVRRAALNWLASGDLAKADVLVVRLAPGEVRANLGFKNGDTVFLLDYARELEYWRISRPDLKYLFMKDLTFNEAGTEARLEVQLIQGDYRQGQVLILTKANGTWGVESVNSVG